MMGFGIAGGFLALLLLGVLGMGMFRGGHRWTNTCHLRRYMTDFPQDFSHNPRRLAITGHGWKPLHCHCEIQD